MVMLEAIGRAAMLEQLAEEAAELAQAALKAARIERGENPTPVTKEEAEKHLIEGYTDVRQCATELGLMVDYDQIMRKERRFCDRISAWNSSKLKENISSENKDIPEAQKPKKILHRKQRYGTPWLCPVCEADQVKVEFFNTDGSPVKEKFTYCWKCGQKLDWGDIVN